MKLATGIALSLLFVAAGFALAQAPGVPSLTIPSPTGEEQVRVENTGPQIAVVKLTQLRDASGYVKSVPLTGATVTSPNDVSQIVINPAGTLAALTVVLEPSPVDGQRVCVYSQQIITALTLSVASGQTINNAVTTLGAAADVCYTYSLSNTTWDRSA